MPAVPEIPCPGDGVHPEQSGEAERRDLVGGKGGGRPRWVVVEGLAECVLTDDEGQGGVTRRLVDFQTDAVEVTVFDGARAAPPGVRGREKGGGDDGRRRG